MLHSKATAALLRLKEMDRKYNIKRNEGKRVHNNISTESSPESSPRVLQINSKPLNNKYKSEDPILPIILAEKEIKSKACPKSKMEIEISINHEKGDESSVNDNLTLKNSFMMSPETKSIIENKNIEIGEEKNISKTKVSPKNILTLQTISEVKVKIPMLGSGDSSRNSDNSSVATVLSKRSDVSEIISETIKSVNEISSRKSDEKLNISRMIMIEDNVSISNIDDNETTIEEVIRINEEKSEITTELSHIMDKNISIEKVSSREERKIHYEDDTFEEASSSVESASSVEERLKDTLEEDTVISGVKQIKITPHKQTKIIPKTVINEDRDREIVEIVPPKIMQSNSECDIGLDEELSNYVKTTENLDEAVPINLLKLSKQITPMKKHFKRKKYRKLSNEIAEEKTDSSVASEYDKLECKENSIETNVGGKESITSIKSIKSEKKKIFLLNEQNKEENIDRIEERKLNINVENRDSEMIFKEDKFLREIPKQSDVTSTLRKLNKDAINAIVRRNRIQMPLEVSDKPIHCKNCKTIVKLAPTNITTTIDDDSDASSLENIKTFKEYNHEEKIKQKKTKNKKTSKSSRNRKSSNYSKIEEKHSRFDYKQTHRLKKYAAILKLQQEREDIRNYLLELEHTRLEFDPNDSMIFQLPVFKPLEFPKIAAFIKPDIEDTKFNTKDEVAELQKRILMIRQWLKDQYILYRNYSNLAQTVNSKYIPVSLEDAKRTIRQLQKATFNR